MLYRHRPALFISSTQVTVNIKLAAMPSNGGCTLHLFPSQKEKADLAARADREAAAADERQVRVSRRSDRAVCFSSIGAGWSCRRQLASGEVTPRA